MPKFSVVTVCLNCENTISRTLESVLSQTYKDFEYIVVDGKSTDNTFEIIKNFSQKFLSKGIRFLALSEKDKGIYDAMNKGAALATGDYVNFLNGGDSFADFDVLVKMSKFAHSYDVVYGNTICKGQYFDYLRDIQPIKNLVSNMVFGHQAAFVKKECFFHISFDETLKISGDYKFFLALYLSKKTFRFVDQIVAVFYIGGISTNNLLLASKEDASVQKSFGLRVSKNSNFLSRTKIRIANQLKKVLPKKAVRYFRLKNKRKYNLISLHEKK